MSENKKQILKPYNAVIQICDSCGKVDVCEGHECTYNDIIRKLMSE